MKVLRCLALPTLILVAVGLLAYLESLNAKERPDAHLAKPGWATGPSLSEALIQLGESPDVVQDN